MKKVKFSQSAYTKKNPQKATMIKRAIRRGLKEYEETFRRLASA
ncbi:MAG: hypothetical protein Q8P26_02420 [Candidatus Levybacteria bacterium]|nr:hypothetical protein [Candidatus Levybacteria bacterium]